MDEGVHDALVLAAAGLRRLGFASRISLTLPAAACVPAPGQGIVAIEIRETDDDTRRAVLRIDDADASAALKAERAVVEALGGGCQTPIGVLATPEIEVILEIVAATAPATSWPKRIAPRRPSKEFSRSRPCRSST